jgi:hypothetical protein
LSGASKGAIKEARDDMRKLETKLPKETLALHRLFGELLRKVESYTKFRKTAKDSSRRFIDLKTRILPDAVREIREEINRLNKDEDFLKRYSSGE